MTLQVWSELSEHNLFVCVSCFIVRYIYFFKKTRCFKMVVIYNRKPFRHLQLNDSEMWNYHTFLYHTQFCSCIKYQNFKETLKSVQILIQLQDFNWCGSCTRFLLFLFLQRIKSSECTSFTSKSQQRNFDLKFIFSIEHIIQIEWYMFFTVY